MNLFQNTGFDCIFQSNFFRSSRHLIVFSMGYEIAAGRRHGVEFGIVHAMRHFSGPTQSELREKLEYRG